MNTKKLRPLPYIVCVAITTLVGALGSLFTNPSIDTWYTSLVRPGFTPPNWVFGPVWTLLFILMGISLGIVWENRGSLYKNKTLWAFTIQLILNLGWSYCFFFKHDIMLAAVEICVLLLAIAVNIYYASKIDRIAAWLLVPYLAWVTFATALTFAFLQLNS